MAKRSTAQLYELIAATIASPISPIPATSSCCSMISGGETTKHPRLG